MNDYSSVYQEQRDFLWGYCYRLSGNAAEAEDLVQDTFVRALEKPPADTSRPWRPWLVRVATNLARDGARRANRRAYVGPWLPSPVELGGGSVSAEESVSGRYDLLESASIAFLLALEALSSSQRAVLLLRDVYDYSVAETAEALELSEANVKTTLHRARKALETYDRGRVPLTPARIRQTGEVLELLLRRIADQDLEGVEKLLAESVTALSDGGGRFYAAKVPVTGAARVAGLLLKLATLQGPEVHVEATQLNGLPAVKLLRPEAPEGFAAMVTLSIDLDADGKVANLYSVLAPDKLLALRFAEAD